MNSASRTITFLFTDLEDSTPLWEKHPALMQVLAARHDELLRTAVEKNHGRVVKTMGDGLLAVFETAAEGAAAALAGQLAIIGEEWPAEIGALRVRMGLHTGESQVRDDDYFGPEVNRAARIMGIGHGGQVLISGMAAALIRDGLAAGASLRDLGEHRLKGMAVAEQIFQLIYPELPAEFPPLRSLSVYKHNLPVQLSSFVGRQKELADIGRLLKDTHLLTLLGPGGTGKTRLMLEAAEEVIPDFSDGVWLVELAPLTDPGLIAERVAAVLSVQEQPARDMKDSLVDYLQRKELLLLLDNVEHLIGECARLTEHLLSHCPGLKLLATGREALFVSGEVTLQVPSLSLANGGKELTMEVIRASEGVQLYLTRVQEVRPDFELSRANGAAIAEIVRRLDGIPLALELAAARTRMLSVEQIAERLDDRFRLLTGGRRTALPRQQTLQAAIDWSWNLLEQRERLLLQRLSVFSGGWSLEAAQAVAGRSQAVAGGSQAVAGGSKAVAGGSKAVAGGDPLDEYEVFDLLEQLVNKSLVTVGYPTEREARYGMLESIRQYGRDRLFESGEGESLRNRHAEYFVAFTEEAAPLQAQSTMAEWTARITRELDNLRAALEWTLEERPELAVRLCGNLFYQEAYSLTPREARSWLEPAIEKTKDLQDEEDTAVRTEDFLRALLGLAVANGIQGNYAAAISLGEESIRLAKKSGMSRYLAYAVAVKNLQHVYKLTPEEMQELEEAIAISRENGFDYELGLLLLVYGTALDGQGKSELALSCLRETVEISRKVNTRLDAGIFGVEARLAISLGDFEEAKRSIESLLDDYRIMNHRRGIIMGQSALAHIYRKEGNFDAAGSYYRQSIVGWQELGHRPAVAHQLECLAYIAIARGRYEHAALLLGAAGEGRRQLDSLSEDPWEIEELAQAMGQLAAVMGEAERDRTLAEGSLMSLDEAVQIALETTS